MTKVIKMIVLMKYKILFSEIEEIGAEVEWVLPRTWRSNLNMKKQKRKDAKADSLYYIPMVAKGLDGALRVLGELDHITDSAGIALYLIDQSRRKSSGR